MKSEELRVCDAYYINSLSPTDSSPGGGALTENKNFCRKFAVIFASLSREVDFDGVKRRRDFISFCEAIQSGVGNARPKSFIIHY